MRGPRGILLDRYFDMKMVDKKTSEHLWANKSKLMYARKALRKNDAQDMRRKLYVENIMTNCVDYDLLDNTERSLFEDEVELPTRHYGRIWSKGEYSEEYRDYADFESEIAEIRPMLKYCLDHISNINFERDGTGLEYDVRLLAALDADEDEIVVVELGDSRKEVLVFSPIEILNYLVEDVAHTIDAMNRSKTYYCLINPFDQKEMIKLISKQYQGLEHRLEKQGYEYGLEICGLRHQIEQLEYRISLKDKEIGSVQAYVQHLEYEKRRLEGELDIAENGEYMIDRSDSDGLNYR